MMETRRDLHRLGEDEEPLHFDGNTEIAYYEDQPEEPDPFQELEELAPSVRTDANRFRMLCDHVENSLSEVDNSMFELLELKDTLLLQFLPANVSTRITLVVGRLYRAYSLSQIPLHELVRIVHLYSQPFDMKSVVIKRFYESNEMKKRMLNAALQKLATMESHSKRHQQMRCINNWEKMYIRLALPRSNVRKWKFRLKTFRETSKLGYEHVIEWLNASVPRAASAADGLPQDEAHDEDDDLDELDRADSSNDQGSVREVDDQQGSDFGDEIGSDNEGSFLSSAGKQRPKRTSILVKGEETEPEEPVMKQMDVEIQATPDCENQQTSTGDALSTKALIIRVYRPVGLAKATLQCIIQTQGQSYATNVFTPEKPNTLKVDNTKTPEPGSARRKTRRTPDLRAKSRTDNTASQEDGEAVSIDKQQCEEVFIPVPAVLKRRSLLDTGTDPEAVNIDVLGDNKSCGSVILSPEDLRMLDLPDLQSPSSAPLVVIDDSTAAEPEPAPKTSRLEFDELSYDLYRSWISRNPQTFTIYNDKRESIGKLPLHMFWYNQVEITHATKCTMTAPLKVRTPTAKRASFPSPPPATDESDGAIPLIIVPPAEDIEEDVDVPLDGLEDGDEQVEQVKASYEDKIARLHDSYRAEILRLRKLLGETSAGQTNEMGDVSELEENLQEILGDESPHIEPKQRSRPPSKRAAAAEHHRPPNYGKNLSNSFLDRYQMFLERSAANRRRIMTKYEKETAEAMERQMAIQHRLHKPDQSGERYDDLCLPAVFMPFRSGNVFNPRAYRFFHSAGSTDPRLTQTPTVFKLPPLPSGSVSVLNLFELSRCYEAAAAADKDQSAANQAAEPSRPVTSPTNQQAH